MRYKDRYKQLTVALTIVALAACGGGSSSGSSAPASAALQTGVFGINPINGLQFATATQSGVTTQGGQYQYMNGEDITFALGGVVLGTVPAAAEASIFSLHDVDIPRDQQALLNKYVGDQHGSAFTRAVNLTIVLQTLDDDTDTENGITISAEVADRFTAKQINLDQVYNFKSNRRMRELLYEAATAGELTPRPIKTAGRSLSAVFPFEVWLWGSYRQDRDGDGVDDYRSQRTYNALGRTASWQDDIDADGVFDNLSEQESDDNGQTVLLRRDDDGDGVFDTVTEYEFDAFGSMIRREVLDADGVTTSSTLQEWDDQGALVRRENMFGSTHNVERWLYVDGIRDTYEIDEDADGTVDRTDTFTFDALGNWLTRTQNSIDDGELAVTLEERTFNDREQILSSGRDFRGDGTFEYLESWEYDANGLRTVRMREESGVLRLRQETDYEDRRQVEFRSDGNGDGQWDLIQLTRYDDRGFVIERATDSDADGVEDSLAVNTYNDRGQLTEWTYDSDNDSVIDRRTIHTYDDVRLVEIREDSGDDGSFERVSIYEDWVQRPLSAWYQ